MVGGIHTLMASQWMCGTVGLVAWGTWEVSLGQGERSLFLHRQDLSYREVEGILWCQLVFGSRNCDGITWAVRGF